MAIWRDQSTAKKDEPGKGTPGSSPGTPTPVTATPAVAPPARAPSGREARESLIADALTIEGKIEGSGPVRVAGRFKGDINVQGDLTIDAGARVTGAVRASAVVIAGELEGNITDATRVQLTETGVLTGDVKATTFTVAAGSRMRGQVEFGWDDAAAAKPGLRVETGPAA